MALISVIGLFDLWTGPELSFGVFYFLPIAAGAWFGSLAHGLLLSLAGTAAWHLVDTLEGQQLSMVVRTWNDLVRFGVFTISSSLLTRLRAAMFHERLLARTDPLTGAANGRTFYEALGAEARWSRELGHPLTLAYLDLDNFKQLNDRLGHSAGDRVLRHLAQAIRRNTRAEDVFARLGGDEFALLLPETDTTAALSVLARIHALLGTEMGGQGWQVTASIGAATFLRPPLDVDMMIHQVDALMYAVKRRGKNHFDHVEVSEVAPAGAGAAGGAERRTAERLPCDRPVQVWSEELGGSGEEPATLRDISAGGVGLVTQHQFESGSLVMIEPVGGAPGRPMLARVVRAAPDGAGWFHGCVLYTRLRDDELLEWLGKGIASTPRAAVGPRPQAKQPDAVDGVGRGA
jgi:diguanylate cyclase (GGDEF)-like protein